MNYLFFFVHPSKFHVFRHTINTLKSKGHHVDVLITSKDVLEDLVKAEGWDYTNIFPEGRKIKGVPPYISSAINFFRTVYRLYRYTRGKNHDLYVTDDLLVYVGKIRNTPSITFVDSDLKAVKQFALVLKMTDHIIAPNITDLGKYNKKKIGFEGYKELAYLHPSVFTPNIKVVKKYNPNLEPFFFLRLVNFGAYHDVGMGGISNKNLQKLIGQLKSKGRVYISAERNLPVEFQKYRIQINPIDVAHILYYAELFVGDSQTMTSEAAVLGTPAFRCNDFVGHLSVMEEKEHRYGLSYNYRPIMFNEMLLDIETTLSTPGFKNTFQEKRKRMLEEKTDLSCFLVKLLEYYPYNRHNIDIPTISKYLL